jgi:cell division protein FtsN
LKNFKEGSKSIRGFVFLLVLSCALAFYIGFVTGKRQKEAKPPVIEKKVEREKQEPKKEAVKKEKKNEGENAKVQAEELTFFKTLSDTKKSEQKENQIIKKDVSTQKKEKSSFTIQVGSFRSDADAQKLKENLLKKGYDTYVETFEQSGQNIWYRVRVGGFETREKAVETMRILKEKEGMKAFIMLK